MLKKIKNKAVLVSGISSQVSGSISGVVFQKNGVIRVNLKGNTQKARKNIKQ